MTPQRGAVPLLRAVSVTRSQPDSISIFGTSLSLPSILKMAPYLREVIWGGRRLETEFRKPLPPGKRVGESLELSCVTGMESVVADGPLAGTPLPGLLDTFGDELIGKDVIDRYGADFPLLIKWLDAQDDLSIQVHPGDGYVRDQGLGRYGKNEAWYVVASDNGRVAAGLHEGVDVEDLRAAIEVGRVEDAVIYHDVKPGDVVTIPPGTVHALCGGVMVYEVQQSSDITFRLYDYNRPGPDGQPRELHIDRGLAVARTDIDTSPHRIRETRQVTTDHFTLDRHCPTQSRDHHSSASFTALTFVSGSASLRTDPETAAATGGDTFLVPAGRGVTVDPHTDCEYLVASVPV